MGDELPGAALMGMQPMRARVRPTVTPLQPADRRFAVSGIGDALADAAGRALQDQQQRSQVQDQVADIDARIAVREQKMAREATLADGMARWAKLRTDMEVWEAEQRANAPVAGTGYKKSVETQAAQKLAEFRGTLGNDEEVLQRFGPMLAEWEATFTGKAQLFETGKRSEFMRDNVATWQSQTANRLRRDPSPENYTAALKEAGSLIAGLEGLDGNAKLEVSREIASNLSVAQFDGLIEGGQYDAAGQMLDSGQFDGVLDEKAMEGLRRQVGLSRDRAAREAELAQAEVARAADDRLDVIKAMAKDGTASDADLREGQALARQYGKPIDQYDLDVLRVENATAKQFGNASLPQIGTAIAATQARIAKAGDKPNGSDVIALRTMEELRDTKRKEAGTQFKELLAQGPQGRMAVLQQLDQYDEETRFSVANEAEAGLGYLALLGPALRPLAVEGREVRKQQPELAPKAKIGPQMRAATGRVGRKLGGEYGPVMETASDVYAAWAAQRGQTEFDGKVFDSIVSGVLGAQRRPDGSMQGGLGSYRGEKVLLPPHLSNAEFAATVARSPFTNARYGNGKPADKNFIVNSMVPELVDELDGGRTLYRFVDNAGGTLRNAQGGEYRLIVEKTR
jgi:hypothetical protein